ncbi:MAG TPA: hypothetical protein VHF67_13650 [Gaiellaceae bacterium]|nr:hypothetical protein [Gaiellaceae bacterium]
MPSEVEDLVTAGNEALEAGNWVAAKRAFSAALEGGETGEALLGLAEALWWLGDIRDSAAYRERAYSEFRRRSDPVGAAECALALCIHYRAKLGNAAASAGWLARATRLIEEFELDEMRGWLLLMRAGDAPGPIAGEHLSREAWELARESHDLDLELCALAEIGASLVLQGRVREGLKALDEAMAASPGGEGAASPVPSFSSTRSGSSVARRSHSSNCRLRRISSLSRRTAAGRFASAADSADVISVARATRDRHPLPRRGRGRTGAAASGTGA